MEKLDAFSRVVHKSKVSVKKIIYKVFKFVMVCLKPHMYIHIPRDGCVGYNTKKKSYATWENRSWPEVPRAVQFATSTHKKRLHSLLLLIVLPL